VTNDEYYMTIAFAVRKKANCRGRRVGAVIVRGNRIVSTGYNGTAEGMTNCLDGGCVRCSRPEQFQPGQGYDLCICVHAEQNAILSAARFGIGIEGGTIYTTLRPCFNCSKAMLQAKIGRVVYLRDWVPPQELIAQQYLELQSQFTNGLVQLSLKDPDFDWANNVTNKHDALSRFIYGL
jgi:dCMP deaminase